MGWGKTRSSVVLPGILTDIYLKFCIGLKLTFAIRNISPESAFLFPSGSRTQDGTLHTERG